MGRIIMDELVPAFARRSRCLPSRVIAGLQAQGCAAVVLARAALRRAILVA